MVEHTPVLLEEAVELLAPQRGGIFVDCTIGLGGHAEALLEGGEDVVLVGIDRDPEALAVVRGRLHRYLDCRPLRLHLLEGSFDQLTELLARLQIDRVAGILADLGVSSLQLERPQRGFSFRRQGPLDMRMGRQTRLTAADVLNDYSETELERIFRHYGEEKQARRVARAVVEKRQRERITTTGQLRDLIHRVKGGPRRRAGGERIDAATRVFQALRIEVNQELAGLESLLNQALKLLESEGRLVVISYHSLEDRIVKHALRTAATGEVDLVTGRRHCETRLIELLTRRPIRPRPEEVERNPRSRSARMRGARKL